MHFSFHNLVGPKVNVDRRWSLLTDPYLSFFPSPPNNMYAQIQYVRNKLYTYMHVFTTVAHLSTKNKQMIFHMTVCTHKIKVQ